VQTNNEEAVAKILGGPTELSSSLDAGQGKLDREMFLVPLVATNGACHFDPTGGQKEVLFGRIGESKLMAIATRHEFVAAYPAEYWSDGLTFIAMRNDVVYEKDHGANTSSLASAMTAVHKDGTWHTAKERIC
jgi:hypothetical protein